MKKILYLLFALVLASACKSNLQTNEKTDFQNNIITYTNGKCYTSITHYEGKYPNGHSVTDTIIVEDIPEPLYVMISNDTVWFNSTSFTYCYSLNSIVHFGLKQNVFSTSTLNFIPNNDSDQTVSFFLKSLNYHGPVITSGDHAGALSASYSEYYVYLTFGRFFNLDNIKEIQLYIDDDRVKKTETQGQNIRSHIIYRLDKELFKNIKK